MLNDLAQEAISSALKGDWDKATQLNLKILKESPKDTDALNRLARAFAETGDFKNARNYAQKVLEVDPFNSIATKSLEKWKRLKKGDTLSTGLSSAQVFIEEPGKTKIISLIHLGDSKTMAKLDAGDPVNLNTHSHRVSVCTSDGKYVGRFADNVSSRIKKLIKLDYAFQTFIKSIEPKDVKIFIKEVSRPKEYIDTPSFPSEKIDYVSFTPPELVHKKDDMEVTPEYEETE